MKPKTIYQVSIDLNDDLDDLKQSHERLMQLNPGWDYFKITSEYQLTEFVQQHFRDSQDTLDNKMYECYNKVDTLIEDLAKCDKNDEIKKTGDTARYDELLRISRLVCRTDIFRLAVVYKYGGLYFDLSKQLEMSIDKVFGSYDVGFFRSDREVHSSIIYSKHPRSKYLERLINTVIENFELKLNNQMLLAGPGLYSQAFGLNSGSDEPHTLHFDDPNICIIHTRPFFNLDTPDIQYKFSAPWKSKLHTPVEGKRINEHWLQ